MPKRTAADSDQLKASLSAVGKVETAAIADVK
jgi:hypothetical protein